MSYNQVFVNYAAGLLRKAVTPFVADSKSDANSADANSNKETAEDLDLKKKLDQGVEMIELSARAGNCLKMAGIRTVRELVSKTQEDLLTVKNFGQKTLEEINEKVIEMGLTLGMKI